MSERPRQNHSRRELFAGALRYAAMGLLTTGGAVLVAKRRRLLREGICINNRLCDGCAILQQCTLPVALSAKKISVGVSSDGR
jgi:hypothetical protein